MGADAIRAENARVLADFEGYLQTCRRGGMPSEDSASMLNGMKHFLQMREANAVIAEAADIETSGIEATEALCLDKLKRERDEARAEAARYKTRLELDHCYDSAGKPVPWPEGMTPIDGIACRDETIKGLDEQARRFVRPVP